MDFIIYGILGFMGLYVLIAIYVLIDTGIDMKRHPENYQVEIYKGKPR